MKNSIQKFFELAKQSGIVLVVIWIWVLLLLSPFIAMIAVAWLIARFYH